MMKTVITLFQLMILMFLVSCVGPAYEGSYEDHGGYSQSPSFTEPSILKEHDHEHR